MEQRYLRAAVAGNSKEIANIPVARWRLDTLTEEDAFDLACHDSNVQEKVLPYQFKRQQFVKHDSYEAVLTLAFHNPDEDYKKSMKMKKEKKKERAVKKARREAKIKELAENEKRKASKSIPKH